MADVVTLVETIGSTAAATAAVFGAAWRPVIRRHDQRVNDDTFLHGVAARPGIPGLLPAGERLSAVEVGVQNANLKIDAANTKLDTLVAEVGFQMHANGGDSLRDKIELIAAEQERVAEALEKE